MTWITAIGRLMAAVTCSSVAIVLPQFARPAAAQSESVVVFAAASLKTALDRVTADWRAGGGSKTAISYAASPALARQIEHDAPAQIFISADLDWMDYVEGKGLLEPGTRSNLLGNRLVLIAPKASTIALDAKPGLDLLPALGSSGRLAIADVRSVPAGKYGRAALELLGAWTNVAGRLAQTENVRAALLLVSRGEAPLGLVYETDAAADKNVRVVAVLPQDSHPPIVYPIALTTKATAAANDLLAFIKSPKAGAHFKAEGFMLLE